MSDEKRNAEISKMLDRQARDAAMIQKKVVESFENITPEDLAKIPIEKTDSNF